MTETFQTRSSAIECDACANSIQRSLGKLAGVQQVLVDVENKNIRVDYDPAQVKESEISKRLALIGFPA